MTGKGYKTVKTSRAVWAVIKAEHPELVVFGSHTSLEEGRIFTSYGFDGAEYPIIEALTTWDVETESAKIYEYWLCLPIKDND